MRAAATHADDAGCSYCPASPRLETGLTRDAGRLARHAWKAYMDEALALGIEWDGEMV